MCTQPILCDRNKQRGGVALLTAMLIVALATVISVGLYWDNSLDMRRTESMMVLDQARQYGLGAEAWAAQILTVDFRESETDHLGENWAFQLPALPIEGGQVFGQIEDLQGRFNVNNLVFDDGKIDQAMLRQLERLLEYLELDPELASLIADWIDGNVDPGFPRGAEDSTYSTLIPPYKTANTAITTTSELLAIDAMDLQSYEILKPHIAALPIGTQLNVNTANVAVLHSLGDSMSESEVDSLLDERADDGFESIQNIVDKIDPDLAPAVTLSSDYFRVTSDISIGTYRLTMYSLLERGENGIVRPVNRQNGIE